MNKPQTFTIDGETQELLADSSVMPRILIFDIETSPMLAWCWGFYKQFINPDAVVTPVKILCYCAKWYGEDTVLFQRRAKDDDKTIVNGLRKLFDQADIIVAHNGIAFDEKKVTARMMVHDMTPPSPFKSVDTLKIARKAMDAGCNKLDYLARYIGAGQKLEHEGFPLWLKCMEGDKAAWAKMEDYNIQDVLILEELYTKLRVWDKRHPNVALYYQDDRTRCVCCGSYKFKKLPQTAKTAISEFEAVRCKDCGKPQRTGTRLKRDAKTMRNIL